MFLVLDKCYVTAERTDVIRELKSRYRFVMPTSFFLETLTASNPRHRAAIAARFPLRQNPGAEVDISRLLAFERQHHRAARPIGDFLKEDFCFNPDLTKPDFPFLSEDIETLNRWETRTEEQVGMWKAQACAVTRWFPELGAYRPGQPAIQIDTAMRKVGQDHDFVRGVYESFRPREFPAAHLLDGQWALFRHTQLHLLAALQFVRKYGPTNMNVVSTKLHNDVLDLDYLILATLVESFASFDRGPRELFLIACPSGKLIPNRMPHRIRLVRVH